ncbi:hypothetical protein BKA93DRAFT_866543 [Sparassis latifolia]
MHGGPGKRMEEICFAVYAEQYAYYRVPEVSTGHVRGRNVRPIPDQSKYARRSTRTAVDDELDHMVLRIGGWVLTYHQVRTWLELGGQDTKNLKLYELSGALEDWFKERQIEDMTPIPTDYPHGTKKPVVILATRYYQDPAATVTHYTLFVERDFEREVKRRVLDETGFKDDDLRWVTVIDPFFQYPVVVYKKPRNYALWPETGRPPKKDRTKKTVDEHKEAEKGDKTDRDKAVEKEDKGGGVEKEDGDKEK